MCESAPKGDGFLTKSCPRRSRSLKLEGGLSVPALTFEPSASLALANALASSLLRKVSVARARERFPTRSLGSNETYQVSLDLLGRGPGFISLRSQARPLQVRAVQIFDMDREGENAYAPRSKAKTTR
jgi:hypothetical protein